MKLFICILMVLLSFAARAKAMPSVASLTVDALPGEIRVEWLEYSELNYQFEWQRTTPGTIIQTDSELSLTKTHVHSPFFIGPFTEGDTINWRMSAYLNNQRVAYTQGQTLITHAGISIQSASPPIRNTTWKSFSPIELYFNGFIRKRSTGTLTIQPIEPYLRRTEGVQKNVFILPSDSRYLTIELDKLSIDPRAFYRTGVHRTGTNLDFNTQYEIILDETIELALNGATMHGYRLHRFNTLPIRLFTKLEPPKNKVRPVPLQMVTREPALSLLQLGYNVHGKHLLTEQGRNYQGQNIKIAMMDEGILMSSNAFQSVSWSLKALEDAFLLPLGSTSSLNHGTAMAEFALDYAPKAELLDFHVFAGPAHTNRQLTTAFTQSGLQPFHFAELANAQGANILNVSLINPSITHRFVDWAQAIHNGLVISKSLGNRQNHSNLWAQQQCLDPANLLPYFYDLSAAPGALVTLQAALYDGKNYISQRARADDAQTYTLTVIESGQGATSQAAATFSGMMAALMSAAQRYNRPYTPQQLVRTLFDTAIDIGAPGVDPVFGHGLVNLPAAIEKVESGLASVAPLYQSLSPHQKSAPFSCL